MASQAVRTLSVEAGQSPRYAALDARSMWSRKRSLLVSAFLALLTFVACASIEQVAHAGAAEISQAATASEAGLAPHAGDVRAIDPSTPEPVRHWEASDAPPVWELDVLEPEAPETDALLEVIAASTSVQLASIPPIDLRVLHVSRSDWVPSYARASAFPRGPPHSSC